MCCAKYTFPWNNCVKLSLCTMVINITGVAYVGTICDGQHSTSVIEVDNLLSYVASIAAHELGHR